MVKSYVSLDLETTGLNPRIRKLTAHRALNDARAAGKLYQALLQDYYQEEEPLFFPNQLEFRVKRDAPATKSQKERLYWLINSIN